MKFYTYAVVMVGIIMLLNLAGMATPVGGGMAKALNLVDDSKDLGIGDFKSSTLWLALAVLLGGLGVSGVVLGAFGRAPDIRYITAALILLMAGLIVADMIAIFSIIANFGNWMKYGLGLIMGGLLVGFLVTAFEFWQGTD